MLVSVEGGCCGSPAGESSGAMRGFPEWSGSRAGIMQHCISTVTYLQ